MSKPTKDSSVVLPPAAPSWPGALLAVLLSGGLAATAHFDWLRQWSDCPVVLRDLVANVGHPRIVFGLWLTLAALVTLLWDARRVRAWRDVALHLEPDDDDRNNWVRKGLTECLGQVRERHALDDIKHEIAKGHDYFCTCLGGRWLKYYLLAAVLPLLGFLVSELSLRAQGGDIPLAELIWPVALGGVEMALVGGFALLLAWTGQETLGRWQWLANQIVGHAKAEPAAVSVPVAVLADEGPEPEVLVDTFAPIPQPELLPESGSFSPKPLAPVNNTGHPVVRPKPENPKPPPPRLLEPTDPDDLL